MPTRWSCASRSSRRFCLLLRPAIPDLLRAAALLCLCLLARPSAGSSQTILNTERFQRGEVSGAHLSADLDLSLKRGNAEVLDISVSGMVGHLSERHWPRVIFGGSYLSDEEDSILDDQFLQLRYSYLLSPRTRTFHFAQVQRNQTLLLDSRWLLGAGIRHTFLQTERASFSLGTGLMGEWEELNPDRLSAGDSNEEEAVRLANLAVVAWTTPSGAQLVGVLYLQPRADDLGDTRLLTDLGLSLSLGSGIDVSVALEWRRDSRPPRALARNDLHLTTGLALSIP